MTIIKTYSPEFRRAKEMFKGLSFLKTVPADQLDSFVIAGNILAYENDERIFYQGERAEYWYLVIDGRVDTLREGADGEFRVVQSIKPGQLLAPIVMFMPEPTYPVSSRVVGLTTLCRLKRDQLHALCHAYSEVAVAMLEVAGIALSNRINEVENLSSRNGPQRLSTYLHTLYQEQGAEIRLPLSHRELSAKLGIRPETLSRLFRSLREQKVVEGKRLNWLVLDPKRLECQ